MLQTTLVCAAAMVVALLGCVALTPCDGLPTLKCTHADSPSNDG
jgi:hypothetical protein